MSPALEPVLPYPARQAFDRLRTVAGVAWSHAEVLAAVDRCEREVASALGSLPPERIPLVPMQGDFWE